MKLKILLVMPLVEVILELKAKLNHVTTKKNKILTFFYDNQEYKITTTKQNNNNVNFYLLYLSVETKSSVEHIQFTMY